MGEKITELLRKWGKSDIRTGIAVLFVIYCLTNMTILMFHPVPKQNETLFNVFGSSMVAALMIIINYYFGSSKGKTTQKSEDEE